MKAPLKQTLRKCGKNFPIVGKTAKIFSNRWKTSVRAAGAGAERFPGGAACVRAVDAVAQPCAMNCLVVRCAFLRNAGCRRRVA
ncbi:MAG: hypothetical protein IKO01_01190 [Kiritimatiellae bacterium]|nr:hypothetical protein [Kiritimatiellia bacterium]MBR4251035.1 hypothetical protein [Kiritimatiellia bacterium]